MSLATVSALLVSCGGAGAPTASAPPPAPQVRQEVHVPAVEPAAPPPPVRAQSAPPAPQPEPVLIAQQSAPEPAPPPMAQAPNRPPTEHELVTRLRQLDLDALEQSMTANAFEDPNLPALEEEEGSLLDEITQEAIPEDVDIAQWREERLRKTQSDLPLTLNDDVKRLINYFSEGKGRATTRATLGRSGAYRKTIERILEEEDVPKELFHLAQAESGFRPKARSYARATGMWQFMAFRGKQYGLRQDRYLEERYDFEKATRAAARHLKDLYIEFGDWYLAFAAYNAGPGRVTRAIERGGSRDYWEMCRKQLLPRQTRDYVPIILAMTYVDKNLDMYDVGVIDYAPERKYDTVTVSTEASLDLIADIAGVTASEIEQMNDALLRSATPPYAYDLRLPAGAGEDFLAKLHSVPADKRMHWRFHQSDEDALLADLARKHKVSVEQLVAVNGLEPGASLVPAGAALHIPTATKLREYRGYGEGGGLTESGGGRYRIASGDTLGGIARRFGVSVEQLRVWNSLPNTRIRAGRYLIVNPNGGAEVASSSPSRSTGAAPDSVYEVRRGDTLGAIAQRYGTTTSQLQSWNGLRSTRIQVGDKLKVPSRSPSGSASARTTASTAAAPPAGGKYRIRTGDNLSAIAERFGVSVDDLRAWNGLRGSNITAGSYLIVSQGGSADPAPSAAAPAPVQTSAPAAGRRYTVQPGDSLGSIASRFGATVANLKQWNGLRSNLIRPGQSLIVNENGGGQAVAQAPAPDVRQAAPAPAARAAASSSNEVEYRIRPGDTLGGIAERFGVTTTDLRSWNKLNGSRITAGATLVVRPPSAARPQAAPAVAAGGSSKYQVQSGDTLGSIAQRHGVATDDLMAWNGLKSTRLSVGQNLITRPPAGGSSYQVRPGDTLEVIAKRFNVSVDDLMRWNGLSSTRIRAGAVLTIRYAERAAGAGG